MAATTAGRGIDGKNGNDGSKVKGDGRGRSSLGNSV